MLPQVAENLNLSLSLGLSLFLPSSPFSNKQRRTGQRRYICVWWPYWISSSRSHGAEGTPAKKTILETAGEICFLLQIIRLRLQLRFGALISVQEGFFAFMSRGDWDLLRLKYIYKPPHFSHEYRPPGRFTGCLFFLLVYVKSSQRKCTGLRPLGRGRGMEKISLFTVSGELRPTGTVSCGSQADFSFFFLFGWWVTVLVHLWFPTLWLFWYVNMYSFQHLSILNIKSYWFYKIVTGLVKIYVNL